LSARSNFGQAATKIGDAVHEDVACICDCFGY